MYKNILFCLVLMVSGLRAGVDEDSSIIVGGIVTGCIAKGIGVMASGRGFSRPKAIALSVIPSVFILCHIRGQDSPMRDRLIVGASAILGVAVSSVVYKSLIGSK